METANLECVIRLLLQIVFTISHFAPGKPEALINAPLMSLSARKHLPLICLWEHSRFVHPPGNVTVLELERLRQLLKIGGNLFSKVFSGNAASLSWPGH